MGYYSSYEIKVEDRRMTPDHALRCLAGATLGGGVCLLISDDWTARSEESVKWYEWKDDLRDFSRKHPGILFTVVRRGEESEDVEVGYFLDGEYQGGKAELRLPEFVNPEGGEDERTPDR